MQDALTVPVILALSALLLFWAYLVTLVTPRRWGLHRVTDVLYGAFLKCSLAAIVTSVLGTVAVSIFRMTA
jgi:hypothetical protein